MPITISSCDVGRLTEREREVAALAVLGFGNRAIADSLVVSRRTVENHLQHVYDKLGVAGRHELAAVPAPLTARRHLLAALAALWGEPMGTRDDANATFLDVILAAPPS